MHIDPENRAQRRILDHRYHKGDWHTGEAALAEATERIRLNPNDAEAYYDLRARAHGVGGVEMALAILNGKPRGEADAEAEEAQRPWREKAIADFTEVIRLNPEDAYAYYCRAGAYLANGDQDKAVADHFDSADEDQPSCRDTSGAVALVDVGSDQTNLVLSKSPTSKAALRPSFR